MKILDDKMIRIIDNYANKVAQERLLAAKIRIYVEMGSGTQDEHRTRWAYLKAIEIIEKIAAEAEAEYGERE